MKIKRFALAVCLMLAFTMSATGCGKGDAYLLKDVYKDYFPIGAAIGSWSENAYGDTLLKHFNSVTADNNMKWSALHPGEDRYTFNDADKLAKYAKDNDMLMRGHTLVWYRATPSWVMGDRPSKEKLLDRMRSHIDTVMKHYGKDIYCWDVANEVMKNAIYEKDLNSGNIYRTGEDAVDTVGQVKINNDWYAYCGKEYIAEAFKQARKTADEMGASDMKLFYNDYGLHLPIKRQAFVMMYNYLKSVGTPIDGVGMQGHYDIINFDIDEFETSVRTILELGLDVQITELDISIYPTGYTGSAYKEIPEELSRIQAKIYGEIFAVCRKYAKSEDGRGRVSGVTVWTVADDLTWKDNDPVPGRKDYPGMFDINQNPKPAFDAVVHF